MVSTGVDCQQHTARGRVAALSRSLGCALEYYDFLIYGAASALFLGRRCFPGTGATNTLLGLATLGLAYMSRPLGAILSGHLVDRLVRRAVQPQAQPCVRMDMTGRFG